MQRRNPITSGTTAHKAQSSGTHTSAYTHFPPPPTIIKVQYSTHTVPLHHAYHQLTDSLPKGPGAARPTSSNSFNFSDRRLLCPLQHVVQNCFVVCRLRVGYGEASLVTVTVQQILLDWSTTFTGVTPVCRAVHCCITCTSMPPYGVCTHNFMSY